MDKIITLSALKKYNDNIKNIYASTEYVNGLFQQLTSNKSLRFFCIEPVTVEVDGQIYNFEANSNIYVPVIDTNTLIITPTSNSSIAMLTEWPGALGTFYDWLEGVNSFSNIVFDMNDEEMYTKWSQGNQGLYHVQFAQYKNCIFWSDLGYISDVSKRTNYTLFNTSELPLCYSTIPENTFKSFYFAYNVTTDPNWSNQAYKDSFAQATWATQVFSYYGLHSIGMFDMDSSQFNIVLPKDCRGLMFYAPNVLNAGVFDAINVTNFGAKSGSWRDAFASCYQLTNLYIKNLKVNLNISWSPINQESLNFILSESANTNKITIYISPHTYYSLTETNKTLAAEKNITLSLIATNVSEDNRLQMLQMTGDGNSYLANDGTYKSVIIPTNISEFNNDSGFITEIPDEFVTQENLTTEINLAIANIVDNAPETLDTLGELATAFKDNADVVSVLNSAIGNKSDVGHNHDEKYYTKSEVDVLLLNFVSKDIVAQMIQEALNNSNPETPTPDNSIENVGSITNDNSIIIDETQLENGIYTLRYIDANDNIIDNFKEITSFEINN